MATSPASSMIPEVTWAQRLRGFGGKRRGFPGDLLSSLGFLRISSVSKAFKLLFILS